MKSFLSTCWWSFALTAVVVLGGTFLAWRDVVSKVPPKPALSPFDNATYISYYSDQGAIDHYVYRFGLFKVRESLQQSDVLLMGSSHMKFGISAADLGRDLSSSCGHDIRVYNLAVGYGEGAGFARELALYNGLHDKSVILDLFSLQGSDLSSYAKTVDRDNFVMAYLHVFDVWQRAYSDYYLDPFLPRVRFQLNNTFSRMLGITEVRRWDTGDMIDLWNPDQGMMFSALPTDSYPKRKTLSPSNHMLNKGVTLDFSSQEAFAQMGLSAVFTLMPFEDEGVLVSSNEPSRVPSNARPFIPISPDGLAYYDHVHLTAQSRAVATKRLFEGLESNLILPGRLSPAH